MIEVAGPQNNYLIFGPTSQRLRGRRDTAHTAHRSPTTDFMKAMQRIHIIPGICVAVDTQKPEGKTDIRGEGVIFDPLREDKDGQKIWEQIRDIEKTHGQSETEPWPTARHPLTNDAIKDWLWAMRRAVDTGAARELPASTKLPSLAEIRALPGKRTRDPLNTGRQDKELKRYVDEVPVGEPAAAGK